MQHIAAVGLGHDPIHFYDDRAGDEVLSSEVHPRAVPGPAPSDEPADGESTADGGKNQSRMISSYLQAKEIP